MTRVLSALALLLAFAVASPVCAGFTLLQDFALWQQASGPYTTLDFTGFPNNTFITDQYADLGVTFLDGNDVITGPSSLVFPLDGWGLDVNESATMDFVSPQFSLGVHHPGELRIKLYWQGSLIYASPPLPGSGVGFFGGVVSTVPFDRAVIMSPFVNQLDVDNIYFGVPAPAGAVVLALGVPALRPRRRRI